VPVQKEKEPRKYEIKQAVESVKTKVKNIFGNVKKIFSGNTQKKESLREKFFPGTPKTTLDFS